MPLTRAERRRRRRGEDPIDPDDDDEDEAEESVESESEPEYEPEPRRRTRIGSTMTSRGNVVWALVTGLAVGYIIGREVGGISGRTGAAKETAGETTSAGSGKTYASEAEFPAGWTKDGDLGQHAGIFAGLTEQQKANALHAMNERKCECGCAFGTLANCLAKDPNCPRSPVIGRLAADLAKEGKSADEIMAAIDTKQKEMGGGAAPAGAQQPPPPPTTPQKVAIAPWNVRKGPEHAKVTIVEFSEFQ
jgi:hypothetical protein